MLLTFLGIYLGRVANLCGHESTQALFVRVQDHG